MSEDPVPVPAPAHNGNEIAVILMVTGMIEYRNRMIASFLDRFEQGSDRLHRERKERGVKKQSEYLMTIADQIRELAQDNAYDIRSLMVHLERRQEQNRIAGGTTGRHGQVYYIQ